MWNSGQEYASQSTCSRGEKSTCSLMCVLYRSVIYNVIIAESRPTLCDPMECSTPGSYVLHCLPEFAQTHVHWVGDAIQPSLSLPPLFLLPSIFPSIGVFSNESALRISWPKYWSFSISASNEYSRLISFRIDWCDLQCNCQFKTHWHTYGCFLLGSSKEAHQAGLLCCHVKKPVDLLNTFFLFMASFISPNFASSTNWTCPFCSISVDYWPGTSPWHWITDFTPDWHPSINPHSLIRVCQSIINLSLYIFHKEIMIDVTNCLIVTNAILRIPLSQA